MAKNIEIKAKIESVEALSSKAAGIADDGPEEIRQDDTFFHCETGRLKLRDFLDGRGELIFYRRADAEGPKESFYIRSETTTPAELREALSLAYGQAGRVKKVRRLYLAGRTRIHLDKVEGLGDYLELEVVLKDGDSPEDGMKEAEALMKDLGVSPAQLVKGAYLDLLSA